MSDETDMREQIIEICAEALIQRGVAGVDRRSLFHDPAIAGEFLVLLRDCRPLPVVLSLIREVERVRAAAGG